MANISTVLYNTCELYAQALKRTEQLQKMIKLPAATANPEPAKESREQGFACSVETPLHSLRLHLQLAGELWVFFYFCSSIVVFRFFGVRCAPAYCLGECIYVYVYCQHVYTTVDYQQQLLLHQLLF